MAGGHRVRTGPVVTIAAGHAVHDTYTAFLPPLLPVLIDKFLLSKTEAGVLSVFMQAPSLLQPFIGHLADRSDLRLAVVIAPAVSAAAMSLLGVAPGYWAVAVLLVVAGMSSAGLHAVAPVVAGRLAGRRLGRVMGLWMVGGETGRTVGPVVAVAAVAAWTVEGMPALMAGGIAASVALSIILRGIPPTHTGGDGRERRRWRVAIRRMGPVLKPLTGVIVARSFAVAAFAVFLPTLLTGEGGSLWFAGVSLSILELAGVAGALAGGWLSDRAGRRKVMAAGISLTFVFAALFLATSGWVRFPVLVGLGLSLFSFGPVIMALVQEQFPENRSLANGIYMSISFVVRSAAVVAVGAVGDAFGLRTAFVLATALVVAGIPFVFRLPARPVRP